MKRTAPVLSRCSVGRCKTGLGRAWRDFSTSARVKPSSSPPPAARQRQSNPRRSKPERRESARGGKTVARRRKSEARGGRRRRGRSGDFRPGLTNHRVTAAKHLKPGETQSALHRKFISFSRSGGQARQKRGCFGPPAEPFPPPKVIPPVRCFAIPDGNETHA